MRRLKLRGSFRLRSRCSLLMESWIVWGRTLGRRRSLSDLSCQFSVLSSQLLTTRARSAKIFKRKHGRVTRPYASFDHLGWMAIRLGRQIGALLPWLLHMLGLL